MFTSGSQIGKYVLDKKLGQGGFGVVFSAYDATLDRTVALKFLKPEHATDREVVHRFLNEARSAAKIVHPGIVTVYECAQIDDAAFIAMELLDGDMLTTRLARAGRLGIPDVLEIGRQLASALGAAHRAGVVHRDLKPDNIFLVPDPTTHAAELVKILDFGIAKLADQTVSSMQTQSMMVFGTPRYMSPEQCRSAANVDARSDIYTLGCILYELVAGRPPFDGQPGELIAFHLMVEPPSLAAIAPETPPALAALIGQMLAKDPAARPQSMTQVQQALEACGAAVASAPPREPPPIDDTIPFDTFAPPERTTTLSSAIVAGPRTTPRTQKRLPLAVYGAAALIVVSVPIAVWFALHEEHGDDRAQVAAEALARPIATPAPAPAPATPRVASPPVVSPPVVSPPVVSPIDPPPAKRVATKPTKAEKRSEPAKHPEPAKRVEAVKAGPPADPNATANPFETPVARGTMSISSRPPCEIYIDGSAVGMHTPQRALTLPAGKHRVQLVNDEYGIKDQFTVDIKPGVIERVGKEYKVGSRDATINPFAKGTP